MPAPVWRSWVINSSASATPNPSLPAGAVAGDYQLIVMVLSSANERITSIPAGWIQIDQFEDRTTSDTAYVYLFESTTSTGVANFQKNSSKGWRSLRIAVHSHNGRSLPSNIVARSSRTNHVVASAMTEAPNSLVLAGIVQADSNGGPGVSFGISPSDWTLRTNSTNITSDGERITHGFATREYAAPSLVTGTFTSTPEDNAVLWTVILDGTGDVRRGSVSAPLTLDAPTVVGSKRAARTATATALALTEPVPSGQKIGVGAPTAEPIALEVPPLGAGRYINRAVSATDLSLGVSIMTDRVTVVPAEPLSLNVTLIAGKRGTGTAVATDMLLTGATLSDTKKIGIGNPAPVLNLTAAIINTLRTGGDPIPVTRIPIRPPDNPLRIIAQDVLTRQWVDLDVQLEDVEYTRSLSGPTLIKGVFKPESDAAKDLGLDAWSTWLHVEIEGQIRATACALPINFQDQSADVEAVGFTALADNYTFNSEYAVIQRDPLQITRDLWTYIQQHPESNFGIGLSQLVTPVRLGDAEFTTNPPERTQAAIYIRDRLEEVNDPDTNITIFEDWTWHGAPAIVGKHNDALLDLYPGSVNNIQASIDWLRDYISDNGPSEPVVTPAKPYELMWWDAPNIGQELNSLAQETPFDFVERTSWNASRTDVSLYLDFGYPRIGKKQTNLEFIQGQNILDVVPVKEASSTFASAVIVIGAGEGRDTIRGFAGRRHLKRVYRTVVIVDKTIKSVAAAQARALNELNWRQSQMLELAEITIDATADGAPLGSFDVGDDILPQVYVPWLGGELSLWHRIINYTYKPSRDLITLTLARSDSFTYGAV